MPTHAKKGGFVGRNRVSGSKSANRSQHVEVVLARIFARQRGYAKQKFTRGPELESVTADWR